MISYNDRIPGYLLGKYQLIATVTFTAFFSLVLMLLSVPVSDNAWFQLGISRTFTFAIVFFAVALLIVIASKRIMYVTYKGRVEKLTYLWYILWNVAEIVIICLLYTVLTSRAAARGMIDIGDMTPSRLFFKSFMYGLMSMAVPYIGCGMYFAIIDKDKTIRVMNYSTVVSDEEYLPRNEKRITLFDSSGVLKLSVSSANLFYIESNDNYIKVWYADTRGELMQYMLRCRLKTIEESFADSSLVRCHRQYIVNMDRVRVLRKEKDTYILELDNDAIPALMVSKTYEENVLARFNSSNKGE